MAKNETILDFNYWKELSPEMKNLVSNFITKYVDLYGLTTQKRFAKLDFSYDPPRLYEDGYKEDCNDWEEDRLYCSHPSCSNFSFPIREDAITQTDRDLIILTILAEHINYCHLNDLIYELKNSNK